MSSAARDRSAGHAARVGLTGKGAFVTHDAITRWDRWLECGLTWCALQHAWTWGDASGPCNESGSRREVTRSASRLVDETLSARGRGTDVWWWAWVVPSRVGAWLDRFAADLELVGEAAPNGVILNLELAEPGGSQGGGRRAWDLARSADAGRVTVAAERLMGGVRATWPGEVWITSHGLQSRRMPWSVLRKADGVLVQAYNPSCSYDSGFVNRCVRSYADGAFAAHDSVTSRVVPLLGANSTPAACMRRYIGEAEDVRPPAVAWWAWTGLAASAAKRAEVARCSIGAPITPPLQS